MSTTPPAPAADDDLTQPPHRRALLFRSPSLSVGTSLNAAVALRIGPLLLDTLFKHYLERKSVTRDSKAREELLYDAAWSTFRAFMDAATRHSVEELQQFSNVRIPAPPWVHHVRMRIPLSCCTSAAQYLITALGGEAKCRELVGGVKWWQARGVEGVDAQWIVSKKDLEREERLLRERRREATLGAKGGRKETMMGGAEGSGNGSGSGSGQSGEEKGSGSGATGTGKERETGEEAVYSSGMDSMRCLLYLHGGGYYFGSVDQERYTMQRYARKMKGRCFAVDYRLAPQYPFPCALQDCVAAYLYLIRPPPGASHAPIPPNRIIFGGDSAGGGLVLSLLQILRDSNLPLPGGAVLISPWCDLTHSFPSIFQNTATDIVPSYGLSIHKPSTLWPPPPEDWNDTVRKRLRMRIMEIVRPAERLRRAAQEAAGQGEGAAGSHFTKTEEGDPDRPLQAEGKRERRLSHSSYRSTRSTKSAKSAKSSTTIRGDTRLPPSKAEEAGENTPQVPSDPLPSGSEPGREEPPQKPLDSWDTARPGPIHLTVDGKEVTIRSQVQLYCTNHQLTHPLVSPVLGYLGGLCPLLVIASDKEVLRDEIIFTAHKAARPNLYPIKDDTRKLYPHLEGIEGRYGPTAVHLQVYDETSHVLPLISFSTPAKYCYRAIAAFCVHVTPTGVTMGSATSQESNGTSANPTPLGSTVHVDGMPDKNKGKPAGMHVDVDGLPRILPESPLATTPEEEQDDWLSKREKKAGVHSGKKPKPLVESPEAGPSRGATTGLPHTGGPLASKPTELAQAVAVAMEKDNVQLTSTAALDEPGSATPKKSHFARLLPHAHASKVTSDGHAFTFPAHLLRSMSMSTNKQKGQSTAEQAAEDGNNAEGVRANRDGHPVPEASKQASEDVAGPRFGAVTDDAEGRKAGDPIVYQMKDLVVDNMIRERVSRVGTIRPLELPEELPALQLPLEAIGVIKENAAKRYLHGQALWDKRFASTVRSVEKDRIKHLKRERKHAEKRASLYAAGKVNHRLLKDEDASWGWGWAIDGEDPPPSSIVARRDTHEARRLARIADKSWQEDTEDDKWAGNRLWTQLADWLTGPGDREGAEDDPFAEGEANEALESMRRRGTIAWTDPRELQPKQQNGLSVAEESKQTISSPEMEQRPAESSTSDDHKRKSTLNPFSRLYDAEKHHSNDSARKSTLDVFRRFTRKRETTANGYASA